jgi:hypothetical protein
VEEGLLEGDRLDGGAGACAFARLERGLVVFERGGMAALIDDVPSG